MSEAARAPLNFQRNSVPRTAFLSTLFPRFTQRRPISNLSHAPGKVPRRRSPFSTGNLSWTQLIKVAIGLLALFAIQGCNSNTNPSAATKGNSDHPVLRRGIGGEPASLDPGEATDTFSFEVIRDLYEGLVIETPEGAVVPGVASSWTVNASGTQYTFHLRRASPVADTLRPVAGAAAIILGRLPPSSLGVTAIRDDLLVVDLDRPAPYFPQLLTHSATFPVYSEETAKSHNPHDWISNGPYVLSNWTPGSILGLRQNLSYWDRTNVRIPNVEYIPIPDENAEYRQYRAGQLDITQSVPNSALDSVRAERPNELYVAPFLATAYYALNLRSPYFATNLDLRKSLALAIDRKALESTILPFGQRPAYGFVPPGTWNYDPQYWEWRNLPDTERIEEARRLYALAGFSTDRPLRLRVLFNSNNSIKQVAIAIASMWKQTLGVDTELIDEEYRVFLNSRRDTSRWEAAPLRITTRDMRDRNLTNYLTARRQQLINQVAVTCCRTRRK